ncbi:hypothetical protein Y032_0011g1436 [Ancylostoma ceylanicum]|uniref:Uncharacterized protein n=1 Tax=Ancylostoma ceylanicum TaxID=53326 RepID=A0A016VFQ7_9BILA|nr:hypothetical protein Y032_0011g1436 [Ancylostoma ceylanicum]
MHALNHEDFFTKSTNARVMNGNRARPSQEPHLRQRVASGYPYENKTNEGKCSGKRSKAVFMVDARQHDDMRYRRGRRGEFLQTKLASFFVIRGDKEIEKSYLRSMKPSLTSPENSRITATSECRMAKKGILKSIHHFADLSNASKGGVHH